LNEKVACCNDMKSGIRRTKYWYNSNSASYVREVRKGDVADHPVLSRKLTATELQKKLPISLTYGRIALRFILILSSNLRV
jgi:hypothetical protein